MIDDMLLQYVEKHHSPHFVIECEYTSVFYRVSLNYVCIRKK